MAEYIIYKTGSPYAACICRFIDEYEYSYNTDIHLFVALLKLEKDIVIPGEAKGQRIIMDYVLSDNTWDCINEYLEQIHESDYAYCDPEELFDGILDSSSELTDLDGNPLPFEFDSHDILLKILRMDTVQPKYQAPDSTDKEREEINKEYEEFVGRGLGGPVKEHYPGLKKMIDDWLEGRSDHEDTRMFLNGQPFRDNNEGLRLEQYYEAVIFGNDYKARINGNYDDVPYSRTEITEQKRREEKIIPREIKYRIEDRDFLCNLIADRLCNNDKDNTDEKTHITISEYTVRSEISRHYSDKNFKADIGSIVLEVDPFTQEEDGLCMPYAAVKRFRDTGELLDYHDDTVLKMHGREHGKRRMLQHGLDEIKTLFVSIDANTWDVTGIRIEYVK